SPTGARGGAKPLLLGAQPRPPHRPGPTGRTAAAGFDRATPGPARPRRPVPAAPAAGGGDPASVGRGSAVRPEPSGRPAGDAEPADPVRDRGNPGVGPRTPAGAVGQPRRGFRGTDSGRLPGPARRPPRGPGGRRCSDGPGVGRPVQLF